MKLISRMLLLFMLVTLNTPLIAADETTIDWSSAKEIKSLIKLKLEPQNGEVTYGPNFAFSDKLISDKFSEVYLSRIVDPEDEEHYVLFITTLHNEKNWRAYNQAARKNGDALSIVTISRTEDVTNNDKIYKHEERLAIKMGFIEFADSSSIGLDLIISGNKTDNIKIPSSYFLAMLQTM